MTDREYLIDKLSPDEICAQLADVYCCIDLAIEALRLSAFEIISIANFKKSRWAERLRNGAEGG